MISRHFLRRSIFNVKRFENVSTLKKQFNDDLLRSNTSTVQVFSNSRWNTDTSYSSHFCYFYNRSCAMVFAYTLPDAFRCSSRLAIEQRNWGEGGWRGTYATLCPLLHNQTNVFVYRKEKHCLYNLN